MPYLNQDRLFYCDECGEHSLISPDNFHVDYQEYNNWPRFKKVWTFRARCKKCGAKVTNTEVDAYRLV